MKKLILFALTAVLSLSFISCGDDDTKYNSENSVSLEGTWKGTTFIKHVTENDQGEEVIETEEVKTTIQFIGDPHQARKGAKGTGKWLDEHENGDVFYNRTAWEVTFDYIVISLLDNEGKPNGTVLYINNKTYSLSNILFSGEVDYDGDTRVFQFKRDDKYIWGD